MNVLDKRLGFVSTFLYICILCYIIVYIFIIEKVYLKAKETDSIIDIQTSGTFYSIYNNDYYIWD